jgi:hypothetical protein
MITTANQMLSMTLMSDGVIVPFELELDRIDTVNKVTLAFLASVNAAENAVDDRDYWRELFFSYHQRQIELKIEERSPHSNYSFICDHDQNIIMLQIEIDTELGPIKYSMDQSSYLRYLSIANIIDSWRIDEEDSYLSFILESNAHAIDYAINMRNYGMRTANDSFTLLCYGIKS